MKWLCTQRGSSEAAQPKSYSDFLLMYSRVCYTLERYEESKHLCKEVLKIDPENKMAHLFLGNTCAKMGLHDEAARAYRTALSIDPAISTARFNLAGILLSRGNVEEAKAEYLKILGLNPDFLPAHANLAHIYLQAESYDEAEKEWWEILRLDPSDENGRKNLAIRDFHKASETSAADFLQAHQLLQRIMQETRREWGTVPSVFLELDRVLTLVNRSSSSSPSIPEVETDLVHVNKARSAFEGVRIAMEGRLPGPISREMSELASALESFEDSLVRLKESLKALPVELAI
jgi:tetratricopeptide (TPR) repeat protein